MSFQGAATVRLMELSRLDLIFSRNINSLSGQAIEMWVGDGNDFDRAFAGALAPNAGPELLARLAGSPWEEVRAAAAKNPNLGLDIVMARSRVEENKGILQVLIKKIPAGLWEHSGKRPEIARIALLGVGRPQGLLEDSPQAQAQTIHTAMQSEPTLHHQEKLAILRDWGEETYKGIEKLLPAKQLLEKAGGSDRTATELLITPLLQSGTAWKELWEEVIKLADGNIDLQKVSAGCWQAAAREGRELPLAREYYNLLLAWGTAPSGDRSLLPLSLPREGATDEEINKAIAEALPTKVAGRGRTEQKTWINIIEAKGENWGITEGWDLGGEHKRELVRTLAGKASRDGALMTELVTKIAGLQNDHQRRVCYRDLTVHTIYAQALKGGEEGLREATKALCQGFTKCSGTQLDIGGLLVGSPSIIKWPELLPTSALKGEGRYTGEQSAAYLAGGLAEIAKVLKKKPDTVLGAAERLIEEHSGTVEDLLGAVEEIFQEKAVTPKTKEQTRKGMGA